MLGIPTTIMSAMRELPSTGVVSARQFDTVSPALLRITRERTANMLPSPQGLTEDEDILSPATGRDHTGLDGVYLELGPTWR